MSKKSETLKQREKAQKDLLELKKMQQGLLPQTEDDDKKPIRTPSTFKEKKDNFFYHHKVGFCAVILLLAVLIFLIVDSATKTKYDTSVVLFTHEQYTSSKVEALGDFFEQYSEDIDKNGKINISVYDCSYNKSSSGHQYQIDQRSRVQARLTAGNAMLFLLDESALNDLNANLDYELFKEENIIDVTELFNEHLKGKGLNREDNHKGKMLLCLREIKGSTAEDKVDEHNGARAILERIKNAIK